MARRHYIDNAPETTTVGSITNSSTTVTLTSLSGWPTLTPYTAVVDRDTASVETVLVTSVVGATATITRNSNGLGAFSHPAGAKFTHMMVALDLDEANDHVNQTSGVHGTAGALVGATQTQTLTNKTLTSPVITGGTQSSPTVTTPNLKYTNATPVTLSANADGLTAAALVVNSQSASGPSVTVYNNGAVTLANSLSTGASGDISAGRNLSAGGSATVNGISYLNTVQASGSILAQATSGVAQVRGDSGTCFLVGTAPLGSVANEFGGANPGARQNVVAARSGTLVVAPDRVYRLDVAMRDVCSDGTGAYGATGTGSSGAGSAAGAHWYFDLRSSDTTSNPTTSSRFLLRSQSVDATDNSEIRTWSFYFTFGAGVTATRLGLYITTTTNRWVTIRSAAASSPAPDAGVLDSTVTLWDVGNRTAFGL